MSDNREHTAEWVALAKDTTLRELRDPTELVGFVETLLAANERSRALYQAIPGQVPPSFQELKEHIEDGKFDLSSVDFVNAEQQFLETATLFPHDTRFQALRDKFSLDPKDVSIKGIFEGLQYARHDRDKKINLTGTDLSYMDLSHHCFFDCNLSATNLDNALLSHADLVNADLSFANLTDADLSFADLRGANLTGAHLTNAVFRGAKLDPHTATMILQAGGIIDDLALSS